MGAGYISGISEQCAGGITADDELATQRNALFKKTVGITVSEAAKMMCNGVALLVAGSDTQLRVCRGYLIFPNEKVFMEHWWTQAGDNGAIFDPLTDLMFGTAMINRLVIDKNEASALESVGSFDCNAMFGPCARRARHMPDCEWCAARNSIERQGEYRAYELSMSVTINTTCKTDINHAAIARVERKRAQYLEQYAKIQTWMQRTYWWNDELMITKEKQWYESCCYNPDVKTVSIDVLSDRLQMLTQIAGIVERKQ